MKVGIDGVLLGAWADVNEAGRILDIGTGSGLIALMLAQRSCADITAIDIEENAIIQARENFESSPWNNRLTAQQIPLQEFVQYANPGFDLIVTNPPFFVNSLKAPENQRNTARHTDTLTHNELIDCTVKLLNKDGRLCLILPVKEGDDCINYALNKGLYCQKRVTIYPKPGAEAKRLLVELSYCKTACSYSSLTIETGERHQYTEDFIALAKDYYLKL